MSEDMTIDRDGVAAEYVLGTLDLDERRAAQALLAQDAEFAGKVKLWERRLGELHLMVEPVEPDPALWERIKARLPDPPPQPEPPLEELTEDTEPNLAPAIEVEPERKPEPLGSSAEIETTPEPVSPRPNDEAARKTAAEVNFESAIAAVESALASHGAATLAKDVAVAPPVPEPPAAAPVDVPDPPVVSVPPVADPERRAGPEKQLAPTADERLRTATRRLAGWRALALLMTLVLAALAALVALWRFAPQRLPLALQPAGLMRLMGIEVAAAPPARRPPPPESQYNE